jgi:hypothetical protein
MTNEIALKARISDIIAEYEKKYATLNQALSDLGNAESSIKTASTIFGEYGESFKFSYITQKDIERSLLKSAWRYTYKALNIECFASANEKKRWQQDIENPPEFTLENIRASFGDYLLSPRLSILKGLAEVFCELDPFYKSHEKIKIGVEGLPKRIIFNHLSNYGWTRDRLSNVINALGIYQNKPILTYQEISELLDDGNCLIKTRGVRLVRFKKGTGHLFFEKQELKDINMALAEYYGDVLCDTSEEKPEKRQESREVSKDLQYYPTPKKVVDKMLAGYGNFYDKLILEPSCGCGRIMDALRAKGGICYGIEYDANRAKEARDKGHPVLCDNFLETVPVAKYDYVFMNPPFYGKHYAKHIEHALKFLKDGGSLVSVLPITARYDHGLLKGGWEDLPVGSFSESGTNINTTIYTVRKN